MAQAGTEASTEVVHQYMTGHDIGKWEFVSAASRGGVIRELVFNREGSLIDLEVSSTHHGVTAFLRISDLLRILIFYDNKCCRIQEVVEEIVATYANKHSAPLLAFLECFPIDDYDSSDDDGLCCPCCKRCGDFTYLFFHFYKDHFTDSNTKSALKRGPD